MSTGREEGGRHPEKGPPTTPHRRKRSAEHTWHRTHFTIRTERARYTKRI